MPSSAPPKQKLSLLKQAFPPKPHWTTRDVPDLTGQTVLVTGGNSGLGKESCRILLSKNARVYMAARSQSKADAAIAELKKDTGKENIFFLQLDLADLKSVRDAANTFIEKEPKLHVLFNNGGVMFLPLDQMTTQGYDAQFGTNVLGHYFFTTLLLPLLISTAQADPKHKARIVHNSSDGAELFKVPGGIDWDSLKKGDASTKVRAKLGTKKLYGQSKLGNILLSNELARRYGEQGIVSISVHPGAIKTDLQRHTGALLKTFLETVVLKDISLGVISQLYAGTADDALEMNGEYLVPWARRTFPDKDAQSPELAKKMWEWCEEQTKGF
ncbi:NAD(P)-binding protein [Dentipellis sp. KUC8613]|nr:NAD(P)-binding protein [Dentipellis sp. KUC8613]